VNTTVDENKINISWLEDQRHKISYIKLILLTLKILYLRFYQEKSASEFLFLNKNSKPY